MRTRMPQPAARSPVPRAAVVLPLPGPVLMRMRPLRDSGAGSVVVMAGSFCQWSVISVSVKSAGGRGIPPEFLADEGVQTQVLRLRFGFAASAPLRMTASFFCHACDWPQLFNGRCGRGGLGGLYRRGRAVRRGRGGLVRGPL